ncbi:SpoIIE family protein phosphatase [Intestinimonas butyriciproducens]|uniref:SpoIIE family protein phosphatase n=1 Tax=Intestinimonas butyriciproducens TaxID=1297617 RepID=UPI001959B44F|nr:SpoIIE family protein phosphatase [Intestinimonas butyriciproducens]MBM6917857.1 SpoIIE family protein phosphatase [Intestinimonas butyriciproducens]
MNTLCMESGFVSLNKQGEDLCGDFFTTVSDDDATTFVLSDGMGSGVKANILATLTAKILATMTANHLSIRDSVTTLAQTLPVCSVRKLAYSTFTLMQVLPDWQVYLAQFDNPQAILLRDGKSVEYPTQELMVGDKRILESRLTLQSGDVFLLMTDGVTHAGLGNLIPDGWQREGVLQYVEEIYTPEISAKNLAARVADACRDLYLERIDDDVTVAVFKMRTRQAVNLLVGPPRQHEDDEAFMHRFFASEGTHIVCGGSTAQMVSRYLGRQLIISEDYVDPDIPPVAKIRGIDLVTEGIVTLSRVLEISSRYASSQSIPSHWDTRSDAATQIARVLLEDATDIHFFVGRAVNPSHQSPSLHIDFSLKMSIIEKLEKILREMGKRVTVEYC